MNFPSSFRYETKQIGRTIVETDKLKYILYIVLFTGSSHSTTNKIAKIINCLSLFLSVSLSLYLSHQLCMVWAQGNNLDNDYSTVSFLTRPFSFLLLLDGDMADLGFMILVQFVIAKVHKNVFHGQNAGWYLWNDAFCNIFLILQYLNGALMRDVLIRDMHHL